MSSDATSSSPQAQDHPTRRPKPRGRRSPARPAPQRDGWSARGLVLVINGVLVGVGGVFVATTSVLVTAIAAVAALVIALVIVLTQR